jgi:hypothetical protein
LLNSYNYIEYPLINICSSLKLFAVIQLHQRATPTFDINVMEGYAKLARLMGNHHTDGHFLIFQKFEQLSAQNLLYLQAEIVDLQESLAVCVKEDSEHPEKQNYATDWYKLSSSAISEQWETWLQLRKKLKEYCKPPDMWCCTN